MTNVEETTAPIVVGVDGSESSIEALRRARTIAEAVHRPVRAVTAWHLPAFTGGGALAYGWDPLGDAQLVLDDALLEAYGSASPEGVTTEVVEGTTAAALIAASEGAFMLVVGSRGHGGFAGLLLGSVSAAVAEHATCPVLIVH
ncbi:MAG TPA: universal stress protein [Pseudolysinimonas sp.]|nr:universal stress protein [Pseudolysinimonas sp.]